MQGCKKMVCKSETVWGRSIIGFCKRQGISIFSDAELRGANQLDIFENSTEMIYQLILPRRKINRSIKKV